MHAAHVPPSGPVKPTLHLQSIAASLPLTDNEWEGHIEQGSPPLSFLNVPAPHAEQFPTLGPDVKPALHLQSLAALLALGESELSGHAAHAADPFTSL